MWPLDKIPAAALITGLAMATACDHPSLTSIGAPSSGSVGAGGAGGSIANPYVWAKLFGADGAQRGYGIAADSEGNVLVAGVMTATFGFGGAPLVKVGGNDIFVAKLGPAGTHVWSRGVGSTGDDEADSVAVDSSGNAFVACTFQNVLGFGDKSYSSVAVDDACVFKLDKNGTPAWFRQFGGPLSQEGDAVATDSDGNVVFAGHMQGSVDYGGAQPLSCGTNSDIVLIKLDANGKALWGKNFGDPVDANAAYPTGVATGQGYEVVAGQMAGKLSFGATTLASAGGWDMFVARLDSAGNPVWAKNYGDNSDQIAKAIATDANASVVVVGSIFGSADFGGGARISAGQDDAFAVKLDAAGKHVWSRTFGDAASQVAHGVAVDAAGDVFVIGSFQGTISCGAMMLVSAGDYDVFVVKLRAADGEPVWCARFGDASGQSGIRVAMDAAGKLLATGFAAGSIDFGGGSLKSAGVYNVFVAKFQP